MRQAIAIVTAVLSSGAPHHADFRGAEVERAAINDNRTPAGILRGGTLALELEVREVDWRPDGDRAPGLVVRAFAERGKRASIPGPLLRVPEGTMIHARVTNPLSKGTLVVRGFSARGGSASAADTIQVAAGATREVRFAAGSAGTYHYAGQVVGGVGLDSGATTDAELHGAFVVDARRARAAHERVLVIGLWTRSTRAGNTVARNDLLRFTINGRTWPSTERLRYTVGDTVRFRVINASTAVHPMHLHGFYFDVNSRGDGTADSAFGATVSVPRVVTERAAAGRTFTMTWVPERSGNWLFHCHDNFHTLRQRPLDGTPLVAEHKAHVKNHALDMMGGLVMAIEVRGRDAHVERSDAPRRRLRLVAQVDSGGTEDNPAYGYVLHEGASASRVHGPLLPAPTIMLERGKPVSITVVNHLREPTAVHWHGIELESYFDGVADFSGVGTRIAKAIAPGDSFVARFTPPRSGTFMYHPHADETRQQQAGLAGALLVVDSLPRFDAERDKVALLTVPRSDEDAATRILINGSLTPDTLRLRVGERYRLRVIDLHTFRPSMIARLQRDSTLVTWRAVAKDGMDLPADRATVRRAIQQMGNGETYDFEFTPTEATDLRLTVTTGAGVLLATMPVVVR
ncbi:MAG TPA: multicopper oxidase domain-containing protein [Gemmatimonadaceae bacterium]|nr:multicopper oxidase domain-containing protein [Gemmatimonadaceae bacterium]